MADEAGVRLSLVHYHFGGKQGLLLEVLERENELLLAAPAASSTPPPARWPTSGASACDFLDEDIRSGYVRVLWELWAAGLADEDLAAGWRSAMAGWRDAARVGLRRRGPTSSGSSCRSRRGRSPRSWRNLFQGIEIELLAGVPAQEAPHREVLDAIGALIERAERKP